MEFSKTKRSQRRIESKRRRERAKETAGNVLCSKYVALLNEHKKYKTRCTYRWCKVYNTHDIFFIRAFVFGF